MSRSGWRNHLPLIRTMTLLTALLALIGWALVSLGPGYRDKGLDSAGWQWAHASSFEETAPPQNGWQPYPPGTQPHDNGRYYWLRISMPSQTPRDPHLWIFNTAAIRVMNGSQELYAFDPAGKGGRLNLFTHWHLAPLPDPLPSEVYLLSDLSGDSRSGPWVQTVNKGDLYMDLLRKEGYSFVLGALFLFSAFIALVLYTVRRDRLQFHFGLLSICGCYASLVRNHLLQVYWDEPFLGYLDFAVFPFGVYAFVSIMLTVFPSPRLRLLDRLRLVILGFSVISLISAVFLDKGTYVRFLSFPLLALFFVTAGVVGWTLRRAYRERQGPDSVWMLSGFLVVSFFALIHAVQTYLPADFDPLARYVPQFARFPFDLLSIGLFLFLLCLIRVILYRFGLMNERLQHMGEFLEKSVRKRTSELDERTTQLRESSMRLEASTRETAETIASSMVLEERNRITGNIHDTVGHSLTATIVQLEAAKRLLDRDPRLAMDKLTASQDLIRRGLEEIRQTARLLQDDFSRYDLTDAMISLIHETERMTEAHFDVKMDVLPDSLTTLQKRVLYQALQEGITNGLRHAGSTRFSFSLLADHPVIVFRLESDGLTYMPSSYGFGLKAMSERVSQLGGVLSVEPGHPGCVLLLSLPYDLPLIQASV